MVHGGVRSVTCHPLCYLLVAGDGVLVLLVEDCVCAVRLLRLRDRTGAQGVVVALREGPPRECPQPWQRLTGYWPSTGDRANGAW